MATTTIEILVNPRIPRKQRNKFDERFSRCYNTLQYTARLILGGSRMAEHAVQNCWFKASQNPPQFENEGPFRSWVLRLLISEALSILHHGHTQALDKKRP
jgi:DNA-directed RNA polymerase specialized sigma24 family protein